LTSVAIYGAGGLGKEIRALVETSGRYAFAGYIDDFKKDILPASEGNYDDILIAIADSVIRKRISTKLDSGSIPFHPFLAKGLELHETVIPGMGSILCQGVRATVDIRIGKFTIININTVIGHDVQIGDFCSIMPCVNIAGNVSIGSEVFIGAGATILQGVKIGDKAVIGAASLVREDVPPGATVVGVPAKELKK
jgi:sugar O-acyltransferase (sialic acid O-acetyltransferase NeuD family)